MKNVLYLLQYAKTTSNSEEIKLVALAIIKVEGIRQVGSQAVSQLVINSIK